MSVSIITFAAVVGEEAVRLDHFLKAQAGATPQVRQLSKKRSAILRIFRRTEARCAEPPIVFFRKYVDRWSMRGFLLDSVTSVREQQARSIDLPSPTVMWMPKDLLRLAAQRVTRKTRVRPTYPELSWFHRSIADAHSSVAGFKEAVLLVAIDVRGIPQTAQQLESGSLALPELTRPER